MSPNFRLKLKDTKTRARLGELQLKHGTVQTPVFMPVGTYGAVRGLSAWEMEETSAEIMLANAFHLFSRPGHELIRKQGGLHKFMSWNRPLLTDSGGFQIFSLAKSRKITEEGVQFQDLRDGRKLFLSPEKIVEIQEAFGCDVMMMLDVCPPAQEDRKKILEAVEQTTRWGRRAIEAHQNPELALFGIFQGGTQLDLRKKSLDDILSLESSRWSWPGIAIGGLSVGETKENFVQTLHGMRDWLPEQKARYLMGVGSPRDLVFSVAQGIDMFDCVMPSRNSRHGVVMTNQGRMNIFNEKYKEDSRPIDETCSCRTCQRHSRAFLRHLFLSGEVLGARLATLHNVTYFLELMKKIRSEIEAGTFYEFSERFLHDPDTLYLGGEKEFSDFSEVIAI